MYSTPFRTLHVASALCALALVPAAFAQDYDPSSTYTENCVVTFKGDVFRAKWWVEPGHSPAHVDQVAHPWDTPWERTARDTPTGCPGTNPPGHPGDPGNPVDPPSPPPGSLARSCSASCWPMRPA